VCSICKSNNAITDPESGNEDDNERSSQSDNEDDNGFNSTFEVFPPFLIDKVPRGLAEYVKIVEEIHFTHIRRRMIRIKPSIVNDNDNDNEGPITLVVDASGLTVSKKGDYIEEKWIKEKAVYQITYRC
jgi:hypothetical protein